jgi:hypothetical protein
MTQSSSSSSPERTRFSLALIGFYASCAGVALGATIGSAGFLWLESWPALIFGSVLTLVSMVTCYTTLTAARRARGLD